MPYILTQERAYWASVIRADMAKGSTAQRACADAFKCHLMSGRFTPNEALVEVQACAHFADVSPEAVQW